MADTRKIPSPVCIRGPNSGIGLNDTPSAVITSVLHTGTGDAGQITSSGNAMAPGLETAFHKTIKKVSSDIEELKFNTAIAALMTLLNQIDSVGSLTADELSVFVRLLCPIAPHLAEEIWEKASFFE